MGVTGLVHLSHNKEESGGRTSRVYSISSIGRKKEGKGGEVASR